MATTSVLDEMKRLADYLDPITSAWVKTSCGSIPAYLSMNHAAYVYKFVFPSDVRAKMNPHISYMIQVELERMSNQGASSSPKLRSPGDSSHDVLPPYTETLLNKLQDHVTRTYLQTASLANPSYAFHDEGHSERIIDYLNQLTSLHQLTHRLSSVEHFLVMAGAWTHDIGFAQSSARGVHHEQARDIVFTDDSIRAYLDNNETAIEVVARLAYNHSSKVDVISIEDWRPMVELVRGQTGVVRVKHLSCLLRLADALDIDHRRTIRNPVLFKKLRSDNPASYAYHLCHQRIQSVRVNPQSRQIDVQALVRTKTDKDRIKRFINERLKLRREVKTLVPHLWSCIPDLKDELNLDIQCTTLAPALPASIVTEEFLNGKARVQAVDAVSGESASEGKSSTSAHQFDTCAYYETGLHQLRNRVKQDHPRYSEFLVYQQRLTENIGHSRRYGDTEARKAERSEMIDHLNELSLSVLGMPFTDLCGSSTPTTGQEPSERLRGN